MVHHPTNTKHCPVSSISYDLCTCKVWSCYVQQFRKKCFFTINIWFDLDPRSKSHEAWPSTSCDLCTCKVWSCYGQWLRWCICKKIHYLTLRRSRSHETLPSTLNIMWPLHQQNLMLLHPMVKEEMHLQENTLFDLDLGVKVTWNVAQCPLHHVSYAPTEFEVTTSKGLGGDAFTRKFIIWPLTLGSRSHKMLPSTLYIMLPIQLQSLKLLPSNGLGENLQENTLFDFWTWQGHTKCCQVSSTLYDLFSYKVWSCIV